MAAQALNTAQKEAFLNAEGDGYFLRNRAAHERLERDGPHHSVAFFARHLDPGARVLEIGCAGGVNLEHLRRQSGARCHGLDPSREAIAQGRARFPELALEVGTADALPHADASMDFVLFGFCLYLVDRALLFRAVAEADRVLRDGGMLGITDFDPPASRARPYRHCPGLLSYKMDYSRLFLANPAYVLVDKLGYALHGQRFTPDPAERVASWVLHKNLAAAYLPEADGEVRP